MSVIKSFSFPHGEIRGDMAYICHNTNAFTVIDCYLHQNGQNPRADEIIANIRAMSNGKRLRRFVCTHPHADHIDGLNRLDEAMPLHNLYFVDRDIAEAHIESLHNLKGRKLFTIRKGLRNRCLNRNDDKCGSCGIEFEWPDADNEKFDTALKQARQDASKLNEICPVIRYTQAHSASYMWMGDLTPEMQNEYWYQRDPEKKVDILFAPHHGRKTGKMPDELLKELNPKLVIIGNAPSEDLAYDHYSPERTLTQNTTGDITFINHLHRVDIYTQNPLGENQIPDCLKKMKLSYLLPTAEMGAHYIGSLKV